MNVEDALQMCGAAAVDFTGGEWCYAANTLAEEVRRLEEQLEAANRLLIDLLSWQPQTQANREVLHPQHRAAIEAAEIFVATPNPAKRPTDGA